MFPRVIRTFILICCCAAFALPARAQQTGNLAGKVTDTGGGVLPGVTVEAKSDVLPQPRVATTDTSGEFRMPALPPGNYTVTFTLSGMQTVTRQAQVQLSQDTVVNATLGVANVEETVTVTATASLIDREAATIKSGVSNDQIRSLPVGQDYRDLVKLIPGVQYTQDAIRGPSAGGSGQDNVYQFDGVNVTLPLFGTLSAEPASYDIAQVTTIKGAARAVDFDRAGGFSIDSVSKSGANHFNGEVSYQLQDKSMSAALTSGSQSRYEQNRSWFVANVGGPVVPNRMYFYGSYYRPEKTRTDRSNNYGALPDYESTRNEGFGKLTYTPISSALLNFSYRHSKREDVSDLFAQSASPTTGQGTEATLKIATVDGSWVVNSRSHLSFKYTHFANLNLGKPDFVSSAQISTAPGTRLDIANLETQGRVTVPVPLSGQPAANEFLQPYINRYGYVDASGNRVGGGTVGYYSEFNDQDFFRDQGQFGYNVTFGSTISHEVHAGYQLYKDSEDLLRRSNGWGIISIQGGSASFNGTPIFFTARYQQQGTGQAAPIKSYYRSQSIELNDTIRWTNFTFNAGLLMSNDTLYGQGLREDDSALSGFVSAPGNRYKMYEIPFSKMLQPRLGATWAYNGNDTIYAGYARYNPAASSLPRAASWDRNLIGTFVDAFFDPTGVLFGTQLVGSSSGKLFVDDLTPRTTDEYLIGTARQFTPAWTGRVYWRYRKGSHFWEDTNNNARQAFNPPAGIPRDLYIPDLAAKLAQIGSGSTYVIAELDGSFTKYKELTLESEWRSGKMFVRGSYTWSHYYGNFDQDNTSTGNDDNLFIGSSNIGDGAGRQLWDNKTGDLRGDRPHMLKVYGYYFLPWRATAGAFGVAQSGQPWEAWNYEVYRPLVGTSTSDTNRYAEPAGSHRTDPHYQLDLKYIQDVPFGRYNLQFVADVYNVFDNQTGYNIQPAVHTAGFGLPRNWFDPRRLELTARFRF
jgi:carboxypeptidase family protein